MFDFFYKIFNVDVIRGPEIFQDQQAQLKGAIIKKNGKIWEKFPNGGGG